jgi:penicillin-binding protein 1A
VNYGRTADTISPSRGSASRSAGLGRLRVTVRCCAWSTGSPECEFLLTCPYWAARFLFGTFIFNPRLGRLRLIVAPAMLYVLFALLLTYVYAPIRGAVGQIWMARVLSYADERSLGTAIYDVKGRFVGIFDPILDSEEDFNYTGRPIELPDYIAYPDHKSLHVGEVPEDYWQCLAYQEDRHLGGLINPFGIDLYGVLKIPVSAHLRARRAKLRGGRLDLQLARIFFKRDPSSGGQPEVATALDPEDAAGRPASPTPEAKAANGHKTAEA